MKTMYRSIITLPDFPDTPPSNIFVAALSPQQAEKVAHETYRIALVNWGMPDIKFEIHTFVSSDQEMSAYQKTMNDPKSKVFN